MGLGMGLAALKGVEFGSFGMSFWVSLSFVRPLRAACWIAECKVMEYSIVYYYFTQDSTT